MADDTKDRTATPTVRWDVPTWFRRVGTNSWFLVGTLLAVAAIIVLLAATRDITVPLAIGIFLAIVFVPLVDWLEKPGVKRSGGSLIVLVGLVIVIGGAGMVTAEALGTQSEALTENMQSAVDNIKSWAEDLPIGADAVEEVDSTASDAGPALRDGAASAIASALDSAAGLVAGLVLGTMVLYYVLKDGPASVRGWVDRRPDVGERDVLRRVIKEAVGDIQGYIGGQTALALVNGVSIGLGMWAIGVPGALAIGVVNVIGAYIPYIGAFIGGGFAVLMALGDGGFGLAVAAFVIVMIAQLVLENLLQPKLLGSSLNLSPLAILLATTFGGMAAGMVGLILAAPALAIGLDVYREMSASGFFGNDANADP